MSVKHPVIAVTGSSGAGTTTVMKSFTHIFRRERINAQIVEGDAFHRHDRLSMREALKQSERDGMRNFSHFGPEANLLEELAQQAALGIDQAIFSLQNVYDIEPFDLLANEVVPAAGKIQVAGR